MELNSKTSHQATLGMNGDRDQMRRIAQLNRLPTRVRLAGWGMQSRQAAAWVPYTWRDHLLLHYVFSHKIWYKIKQRLRFPTVIFYAWSDLHAWTTLQTNTSPMLLWRLATQSAIYNIWNREKIFPNLQTIPPSTIFKKSTERFATRSPWRHRGHFRDLMIHWI